MIDDDPDIALSIPLKSLYEEFCCPICFNTITDCFITPCGHNFCSGCIKECLNRKHQCPCCNAAATAAQLLKNHHHDRIVTILTEEKDIASKKYFEKLIKDGNRQHKEDQVQKNGKDNNANANNSLSPVELLFHKHLKKSLVTYEEFYKELEKKYSADETKLKDSFAKLLSETNATFESEIRKNPSQQSQLQQKLDEKIVKLTADWEFQQNQRSKSFQESIDLLLESYESYLTSIVPTPSMLPVAVSVLLPVKNILFKKIVVKVTENSTDLMAVIGKKLEEMGDALVKPLDEKNSFVISRSGEVVNDRFRPLVQYKLLPNDQLVVQGPVELKSDKPKQCFTETFVKGGDVTVTYYTCKECKINWICPNCAEKCHSGHTITEYIANHKPTWACCYCAKNKANCKLVKK